MTPKAHQHDAETGGDDALAEEEERAREERRKLMRRRSSIVAEHRCHHHPDGHKKERRLLMIAPPKQRQRWGETQILPHVNWGDIFFDLFYVGAAYNLAAIMKDSPTWTGYLYFCGCFFPTMMMWVDKMYTDSRFSFHDDIYHRIIEVFQLCVLATAIVHIRPVSVMSNPYDNVDMLKFSVAITWSYILSMVKSLEIWIWAEGDPAARISGRRDLLNKLLPLSFYIASTVVSGTAYYGSDDTDDGHHSYSKESEHYEADSYDENHHFFRGLAAAGDTKSGNERTTDVPIWLCFGGFVAWGAWLGIQVFCCFPGDGRHKKFSVPMNVEFSIHRYGEWIMLMLGSSILNLLIVDVPSGSLKFYVTFFAGVLSVVLMQYLHFRSQPHHADEHAIRRSKNAGFTFTILLQIYSSALVVIGVCYKMLLTEYTLPDTKETEGEDYETRMRRLLASTTYFIGESVEDVQRRVLAGGLTGAGAELSVEERRQRVANAFSNSLALTWICLDAMILTHRGVHANFQRCQCAEKKKISLPAIVLTTLRVGLIVVVGGTCRVVTDPEAVALIGLLTTFGQVVLRMFGDKYLRLQEARVIHAKTDDESNHAQKAPGKAGAAGSEEEVHHDAHQEAK